MKSYLTGEASYLMPGEPASEGHSASTATFQTFFRGAARAGSALCENALEFS